jgi:penicillin-binding protein 1B
MSRTGSSSRGATKTPSRRRRRRRRSWPRYLLLTLVIVTVSLSALTGYYYVYFAKLIDERLHGERVRALPKVFGRPFEVRRGQALTGRQLVNRLNELGYTERQRVEHPGQFAVQADGVSILPREGSARGRQVKIFLGRGGAVALAGGSAGASGTSVVRIEVAGGSGVESVTLDPPLITAVITTGREKRRKVALSATPRHVVQAVLAIEDRRFYSHPGVDPFRMVAAAITNIRGDTPYLVGASTITQQLVKNFFLTPEKSFKRKLLEQFMAVVLEQRATKDEILELYLNEVYLGQRGSFAIHGVAEAARMYFGKDVTNLTLPEAATVAGVIQAPFTHSPFSNPDRARDRRNVVLASMAATGFITPEVAERAAQEPVVVQAQALEAEASYFVDWIGYVLSDRYPGFWQASEGLEVHTTLDLHLQQMAQEAVRQGLARVDELLARRRPGRRAQAALIAVDPATGEILALVGGRSYSESQFNRAVNARRQPGSVFKPFVYLAAFEKATAEGRIDVTPASMVVDEPAEFRSADGRAWNPGNYDNEYDGAITLRRALALSRNLATIKVAEAAGFDQVASLWRRIGAGAPPQPYPSIALGVFEASPLEIATAFTTFPNLGEMRPLQSVARVKAGSLELRYDAQAAKRVARPETTFLVLSMLQSVINEGTGVGARAGGFRLDAAGKTGTTNDLRDAWFVGFTPGLLAVVWVGFDDNQPLGLSGSQAALPIWTRFMTAALAGQPNRPFVQPDGIVWVEIDRDTGKLALPGCPRVMREAFVAGTEPTEVCELHRF